MLHYYRKNLKFVPVAQLTGQSAAVDGFQAPCEESFTLTDESNKISECQNDTNTPAAVSGSNKGVDAARERYLARKQLVRSRQQG